MHRRDGDVLVVKGPDPYVTHCDTLPSLSIYLIPTLCIAALTPTWITRADLRLRSCARIRFASKRRRRVAWSANSARAHTPCYAQTTQTNNQIIPGGSAAVVVVSR